MPNVMFPLLMALGVLLAWSALTTPPRVNVSRALNPEGERRGGLLARLDERLARAGIPVSARELISSGLALGSIAGALMFIVTGQFLVALLLMPLGMVVVFVRAESKREQAERDYQEGLVEAMDTIRQSYGAHTNIRGAMGDAAAYAPAHVRDDFAQAQAMLLQGSKLEEAFAPIQARRRSLFLDMIVEAIGQRDQEGGDFKDVLANIQDLIREQNWIYRRMIARQAQARIEAMVVCLAPLAFLVFVRTVFRDYEQGFYNTVVGQLVIIGAFLLDGLAYLLSRKIARSGMEMTRFEVV